MNGIALTSHSYNTSLWLFQLGPASSYLTRQPVEQVLALFLHVPLLSIASLCPCLSKIQSGVQLYLCAVKPTHLLPHGSSAPFRGLSRIHIQSVLFGTVEDV